MRTATCYSLRPMRLADIPQVMEVERESFPAMWPPTAFKRELQQNRLARYTVVVEHNPRAEARGRAQPGTTAEHSGALGRLIGELWHILGPDGEKELPPPEERPELVVGFIGFWLLPEEAHIITIAVRGSHRRRGVGELLLISAIELAQSDGQELITLECRATNKPALLLYNKYGFEQVGVRRRYYSDNHEDACVLSLNSLRTQKYREAFGQLKAQHRHRWDEFDTEVR